MTKLLQSIRYHGSWKSHKEALNAYFLDQQAPPALLPSVLPGLTQGLSQERLALNEAKYELAKELLAGRVPTAEDWRDALLECGEGLALRKGARMKRKRTGDLDQVAANRAANNLRKMRRNQYIIMADVERSKCREALREAFSCSIALDGSAGRKVVRFRCDQPQAPWFKDGVIGILDENAFQSTEEFGDDHADRGALKLDELLARFCTPLKGGLDQGLKDHILKIVHVISADGCPAERRALHLAAQRTFENMIELIRDPAHAIRIAMQSLHKNDDFFKEMWDELFDNKHSVVPCRGHIFSIVIITIIINVTTDYHLDGLLATRHGTRSNGHHFRRPPEFCPREFPAPGNCVPWMMFGTQTWNRIHQTQFLAPRGFHHGF